MFGTNTSADLSFQKARLAPTPSGYLHLGNVLSFAITSALASRAGAKVFLRIDDVDRERTDKRFIQDIFDTLHFLEIPWHEGPRNMEEFEQRYSQVCRLGLYHTALQQLRDSGKIFACTCSRTDIQRLNKDNIYQGTCCNKNIPLDTPNITWRLNTSSPRTLDVKTLQDGKVSASLPAIMQHFVVRRRDGYPGYQLTSLIDDLHFGIDFIVRGDDLWPSTLAQQYLAAELGKDAFSQTTFYHHPLLLDAEGHKLSKSLGAPSVQYFRTQQKKPADIYALIAGILGGNAAAQSWQELGLLIR